MEELSHRKHLAIGGKSFSIISTYFPELLEKICVQGTIFARMSPDQKCQLIEHLQELDYTVGMCGDGANDCEALKAAHAGISLSEAEASVAAPFTSCINNIECVVTAMREGRAALVTSFGCFKYMALYSFIQFVSVLILYTYTTNLSDFEFLYIDLVITTSIAVLMGNTGAYQRLVKKTPPGSLVKPSNLLSILSQVMLVGAFQLAGFFYLQQQSFYKHDHDNSTIHDVNGTLTILEEGGGKESKTWETTVIFLISCFMYISVAFTFSKGPPFRKRIYTNVSFSLTLLFLFGFSTFLLLYPVDPITDFMEMKHLDSMKFRLIIFGMAIGHSLTSLCVEWVVIDSGWLKCLYRAISQCKKDQPSKYKVVQMEIMDSDWPPVDQTTFSASSPSEIRSTEVVVEMNSASVH